MDDIGVTIRFLSPSPTESKRQEGFTWTTLQRRRFRHSEVSTVSQSLGWGARWGTQPGFKFRLRWLHKHFPSRRWWSTATPSSVTLESNANMMKRFQTFSGLILIPPSPHHLKPTAPQVHLFLSLAICILINDFYLIFHSHCHSRSSDHQHCSHFGSSSWLASLLRSYLFSTDSLCCLSVGAVIFPYKTWTHSSLAAPLELSAVISII